MNQILLDYCHRFTKADQVKPVFEDFFTNLDIENHWQQLPYLHSIQNFCLRLHIAYLKKEKICIYSDYDTDAVTATGTMYHGLLDLGFDFQNVEFYAPDRFTEGYGMNTEAVGILAQKFDLIISVDCGINSTLEAQIILENNKTNEHKCDLIITDHHHLHAEIPNCVAVINCRMGQVYSEKQANPEINQSIISTLKSELSKETLAIKEQNSKKIQNLDLWLQETFISFEKYESNPEKFLSQSTTGVGVAWFCLVWYGYFVEYLES